MIFLKQFFPIWCNFVRLRIFPNVMWASSLNINFHEKAASNCNNHLTKVPRWLWSVEMQIPSLTVDGWERCWRFFSNILSYSNCILGKASIFWSVTFFRTSKKRVSSISEFNDMYFNDMYFYNTFLMRCSSVWLSIVHVSISLPTSRSDFWNNFLI